MAWERVGRESPAKAPPWQVTMSYRVETGRMALCLYFYDDAMEALKARPGNKVKLHRGFGQHADRALVELSADGKGFTLRRLHNGKGAYIATSSWPNLPLEKQSVTLVDWAPRKKAIEIELPSWLRGSE